MYKKQIVFLWAFIAMSLISCGQKSNGGITANSIVYCDTILPIISEKTDTLCAKLSNTYYKRFGITISSYYIIRDSLAIDLNNDYFIDTVVIFSPVSLEPIAEDYNCNFQKQPKRILVEVINNNGSSKIRGIYSNILTDVGGVLSHYSGIFKTNDGFKIVHQAGAKYSWTYTIELSNSKNDKLSLVNISKVCSFEGNEIKQDYNFKALPIEEINMPDTLQLNCNCEKHWLELEKK